VLSRRYQNPCLQVIAFAVFVLGTAIISGVTQAATPAATPITNRVMAVYPWEGMMCTSWSNWVTVVVQQVAGVVIYPCSVGTPASDDLVPACAQSVASGQQVLIPYRLTNTGNGVDTFRLTVEPWPANAAQSLVIYLDRDGDAIVDPSDPEVDRVTLSSQESAAVLVTFRIPDHAADGDVYYTALRAESVHGPSAIADQTWSATTVRAEAPNLFVRRSYNVDLPPPQGCLASAKVFRTLSATSGANPLHSVVTHTLFIDNTGCHQASCVRLLEPLHHNETLLADTYGPNRPLLINGMPISLGSDEPPMSRLITDPDGNRFLEIYLTHIEPRPQKPVVIEYRVSIDWQPEEQQMPKVAEVIYERHPGETATSVSNQIVLNRDLTYGAQIVPKNSPVLDVAYVGELVQFRFSLINVGERCCVPEIVLDQPVPEGWLVSLCESDGVTPMYDSNNNGWVDLGTLAPGAGRDIVLNVFVPDDKSQTTDTPYLFPITFFHDDLPECSASIAFRIERIEGVERVWDPLHMEVNAGEVVIPGSLLTYGLNFKNASDRDIHDVVVTARFSPHLRPPIAMDGQLCPCAYQGPSPMGSQGVPVLYDPDRHEIVWTISSVPKGIRGNLLFSTQVAETVPKGAIIQIQAELACALTGVVARSNSVSTSVITDELVVGLSADDALVAMGEENTYYVAVSNASRSIDLHGVEVRVCLPPGITYRRLTSHRDGNRIADPVQSGRMLVYHIDEVPRSSTVRLSFNGIVNAAADHELTVLAVAAFRPRADEALESAMAKLTTYVIYGILSDEGVIVGRLCTGEGQPVRGVRVVLDNGRYAISDGDGRFSFTGLSPGPRLLRLDPATLCGAGSVQHDPTVRVVVPTAGIAMVELNLTPVTINVVTEDSILGQGPFD
jgi:hypothetical protein